MSRILYWATELQLVKAKQQTLGGHLVSGEVTADLLEGSTETFRAYGLIKGQVGAGDEIHSRYARFDIEEVLES